MSDESSTRAAGAGGGDSYDVARFMAFTDGVAVVAMTLLILNVQLPSELNGKDGAALVAALRALGPHYLGYIVSFLVISQYWLGYTRYFRDLTRIDDGFAWLNICFLLAIGFLPFATSVLSENEGWVATSLYAAVNIAIAAAMILMALYARRRGLHAAPPSAARWQHALIGWLHIVVVFALSIAVAQFAAGAAKWLWLLLAIPHGWIVRRTSSAASA